MTTIHDKARAIVLASHGECTLSEAYAALAKRRRRACKLGVLHVGRADRRAFDAVESPRFAWQDRADFQ